jgi:hypothetical protein
MRGASPAVLAAAVLLTGCAAPHRFAGTVPSILMRPGACHRLAELAELDATSDVAPPVPCSSPHRSETFALVRLPAILSLTARRPDFAGRLAGDVCAAPTNRYLRSYLGADDLDRHWGVDVWLKLPTRSEWRRGLRLGRCDLVLGLAGHSSAPELTHPLHGALRRADSADIRHCRGRVEHVTCDRPHIAEEVGGWTGIVGGTYPGMAAATRQLDEQCWRNAERYTGGAVDRLPVRPTANPLSVAQWRKGVRSTSCWLINKDGHRTRGTLRAGLTKDVSL